MNVKININALKFLIVTILTVTAVTTANVSRAAATSLEMVDSLEIIVSELTSAEGDKLKSAFGAGDSFENYTHMLTQSFHLTSNEEVIEKSLDVADEYLFEVGLDLGKLYGPDFGNQFLSVTRAYEDTLVLLSYTQMSDNEFEVDDYLSQLSDQSDEVAQFLVSKNDTIASGLFWHMWSGELIAAAVAIRNENYDGFFEHQKNAVLYGNFYAMSVVLEN